MCLTFVLKRTHSSLHFLPSDSKNNTTPGHCLWSLNRCYWCIRGSRTRPDAAGNQSCRHVRNSCKIPDVPHAGPAGCRFAAIQSRASCPSSGSLVFFPRHPHFFRLPLHTLYNRHYVARSHYPYRWYCHDSRLGCLVLRNFENFITERNSHFNCGCFFLVTDHIAAQIFYPEVMCLNKKKPSYKRALDVSVVPEALTIASQRWQLICL